MPTARKVAELAGPLLITGASGFLGRHVLGALAAQPRPPACPTTLASGSLRAPRRLLALVRDRAHWQSYGWTQKLAGVELVEGGVGDPERWAADPRLAGLRGIFHLAALVRHSRRDPGPVYRTQVEGTLHMVRVAAQHRARLVYLSTTGTVGCFRSPEGNADEHAPYCEREIAGWPYYDSKLRAERAARALAAELGVELVILRPPVLLGPGDHRRRSTGTVQRFLERRLPFLIRGGMHFTDVRDVAAAALRAMAHPAPQPVYHLPGHACSIERFFADLAAVSGVPAPRRVLPYTPAHLLARLFARLELLPDPVLIEMAAHYWGARSLYAERDLGFAPRPPLETLRDTVEWLRAADAGSGC
jgi:dihydroflavonol-4-reductase